MAIPVILAGMKENDWSKILGWPGYKVYRHEIDERAKTLKLWVRRNCVNKLLMCSGCGKPVGEIARSYERAVPKAPDGEIPFLIFIDSNIPDSPKKGLPSAPCGPTASSIESETGFAEGGSVLLRTGPGGSR